MIEPMARIQIRLARSGDSRALADLRYRFRTETEPATETKSRFLRRCIPWMKKRFRSGSSPWRCWVLDDGKQLLGHVCVQLFEKVPNPVTTNRSFMPTSQTFMSSRKCGAMDLERDCWKKRYHGAALGGSMRSFCGRLPEAYLFIAAAVWLRLRTSLNCERALVSHTEFNVESLLGPSARNLPRNSCRRVSCNDWHDSAEHRSDPEFANFALNSLDAHCNRRVALIFLVVCERTRMAAKYRRKPDGAICARLRCRKLLGHGHSLREHSGLPVPSLWRL